MLKISSVKLTRNWIIHNFTRKYQMRRLKQTERKSTNNWETASVSSIENLLIKWFRKIYSKNYSETVKKMLLTMMAMSNIYVNECKTNKICNILVQAFLDNFIPGSIIELELKFVYPCLDLVRGKFRPKFRL